jgi:hypothetical protein
VIFGLFALQDQRGDVTAGRGTMVIATAMAEAKGPEDSWVVKPKKSGHFYLRKSSGIRACRFTSGRADSCLESLPLNTAGQAQVVQRVAQHLADEYCAGAGFNAEMLEGEDLRLTKASGGPQVSLIGVTCKDT